MRKEIVDMNYKEQVKVLRRIERELFRRYPGLDRDILFIEYLEALCAQLTGERYWNSERYDV